MLFEYIASRRRSGSPIGKNVVTADALSESTPEVLLD